MFSRNKQGLLGAKFILWGLEFSSKKKQEISKIVLTDIFKQDFKKQSADGEEAKPALLLVATEVYGEINGKPCKYSFIVCNTIVLV